MCFFAVPPGDVKALQDWAQSIDPKSRLEDTYDKVPPEEVACYTGEVLNASDPNPGKQEWDQEFILVKMAVPWYEKLNLNDLVPEISDNVDFCPLLKAFEDGTSELLLPASRFSFPDISRQITKVDKEADISVFKPSLWFDVTTLKFVPRDQDGFFQCTGFYSHNDGFQEPFKTPITAKKFPVCPVCRSADQVQRVSSAYAEGWEYLVSKLQGQGLAELFQKSLDKCLELSAQELAAKKADPHNLVFYQHFSLTAAGREAEFQLKAIERFYNESVKPELLETLSNNEFLSSVRRISIGSAFSQNRDGLEQDREKFVGEVTKGLASTFENRFVDDGLEIPAMISKALSSGGLGKRLDSEMAENEARWQQVTAPERAVWIDLIEEEFPDSGIKPSDFSVSYELASKHPEFNFWGTTDMKEKFGKNEKRLLEMWEAREKVNGSWFKELDGVSTSTGREISPAEAAQLWDRVASGFNWPDAFKEVEAQETNPREVEKTDSRSGSLQGRTMSSGKQDEVGTIKFCPNCGAKLLFENGKFCQQCGSSVVISK